MPSIELSYNGDLRTTSIHKKSGSKLITDAPTDNQGKGEAFSPTDLVATALASCMLTLMGIHARKHNFTLGLPSAQVTKVMKSGPRQIAEIHIEIAMNKKFSPSEQELLEHAAKTCPVALSLHETLDQRLTIHWLNPT